MKYRLIRCGVVVLGVLALVSISGAQNAAPVAKPSVSQLTPRTADGHVDFSGFYNRTHFYGDAKEERPGEHIVTRTGDGSILFDYGGANEAQLAGEGTPDNPNPPPYKLEYMAKVKEIARSGYGTTLAADPVMDCKPLGVPRGALNQTGPTGMLIAQVPTMVIMLYEAAPGPYYRVIYMDGRPHPKDFDSSYYGDSIGHWEGDTLVVDVVGLNDQTWLGSGQSASIHSDQLHVVERWTRDGDTITYQATVEDPVTFTKPWVLAPQSRSLGRADDYLQPQMCVGNDKEHLVKESEKDPAICGWCNPVSLYGLPGNGITTGQTVRKK